MTSNQILVKTDLGKTEIANQDGILPREARTLLILVDGKSTIDAYREKLNKTAMFSEAGGVDQAIQLLFDLGYVIIESAGARGQPVVDAGNAAPAIADDAPTVAAEVVVLEDRRPEPIRRVPEPEEVAQVSLDEVRSKVAEYLESMPDAANSWTWLMKLESCNSPGDYVRLIDAMQNRMKLPRPILKIARTLSAA